MFFIREKIENKEIKLEYVQSEENLADQFTKIISRERLMKHNGNMGIKDSGGVLVDISRYNSNEE